MFIQCTKALLDKMEIKKSEFVSPEGYDTFPDSVMAWHAHFVTVDRRKAIVLMNNETRYSVVIYRPKKQDFAKIKNLIFEAIAEAFRMEGVRKEVIDVYMAKAGEISFSKTANRSLVAKMNNVVRDIGFFQEYLDEETRIQRYISMVTGRLIQLSGTEDPFFPYEKMLECLAAVYGIDENETVEEILDIDLYQLRIQIDLEGHDIWRRVLVPSTYSFRHLHRIIQIVFDWQNYHLHDFNVERGEDKPLKIVMNNDPEMVEYLDFDKIDIKQEQFVLLEDVFPKFGKVVYEYDFGDSWQHTITFEKVVKSKTLQATYLDGNGERPPEDVGGAGGFEEYLSMMADEKHPRHKEIKAWAESQKERKLSREKINQRLKRVMNG